MNSAPYTTQDEFRRILATLPEAGAVATVGIHAETGNLRWLGAALDEGWLADQHNAPGAKHPLDALDWSNRAQALNGFLKNAQVRYLKDDPVYGPLPHEVPQLVLDTEHDFKALFKRFVNQAVETVAQQGRTGLPPAGLPWIDEGFGHLMLGAVALDLPDSVATIARMWPESIAQPMKISLGSFGGDLLFADEAVVHVNAQGLSMLLDRRECLDAIMDTSAWTPVLGKAFVSESDIPLGLHNIHEHLAPGCSPSAFEAHLRKTIKRSNTDPCSEFGTTQMEALAHAGLKLMRTDTIDFMDAYARSFSAAGVYDEDPLEAFRIAALRGHPGVLTDLSSSAAVKQHLDSFPVQSAIASAARFVHFGENDDQERKERALLELIELAIKSGRSNDMVTPYVGQEPFTCLQVMQPLADLAKAGQGKAIARLVQLGLDPQADEADTMSALNFAKQHAPDMATVMHSAQALNQARDMINQHQRPSSQPIP